jgi:ABC-type transport system substrate-binding protein
MTTRERQVCGRRRGRRVGFPRAGRFLLALSLMALIHWLTAGRQVHPRPADLTTWHGAFAFEPGPLDPARAVTVTDGSACSLIYSGLVRFDAEGQVVADLAKTWEISADGLVYVFHLRDGVRFHDGAYLTAQDVVYSFSRILDPQVGSSRAWVLEGIQGGQDFLSGLASTVTGLVAADARTVVITLERPVAHFPSLLAMPAAYVVRAEVVRKWGEDFGYHPVGTGPWRLAYWREGIEMRFEAFAGYFGARPCLQALSYRFIPDPATRQAEFEAGNLEILTLGEENVGYFARHPRYSARIVRAPELAVVYVALNCGKPPLDNVLVRRALNHAIDRKAILDAIRPGRYTLANGSIPPKLGGEPTGEGYAYDPALARSLLAEAGYPNGFKMDLVIRAGGLSVFCAEPIQAELARVGVSVRIVSLETRAFFARTGDSGDPDACLLSWVADYADAENFLFPLFHSTSRPSGGNNARFTDTATDQLLDEARREIDPARRAGLYRAAERAIFAKAPWIPLFFPVDLIVCQPEVRGFRVWPIYSGCKMTEVWLEAEPGWKEDGRP